MPLPDAILAESQILFHDTRVEDVDLERHAPFVIARVLERGTAQSVRALFKLYGKERIRQFFRDGGTSQLSRRTIPLWLDYFQLSPDECISKSFPRPRSPFWPY